LIVFLVFADWHNRILIPLRFPDADFKLQRSPLIQYSKLGLEITNMVLLVLFYGLINESNGDKYWFFTAYLGVCLLWNWLMINVMGKLQAIPLFRALFNGKVFDMPDLGSYTKRFIENIKAKESELHTNYQNSVASQTTISLKDIRFHKSSFILNLKVKSAKFVFQLIGSHILWINGYVLGLLLLPLMNYPSSNNLINSVLGWKTYCIVLLITLIVLLITFLFNRDSSPKLQFVFGTSMIFSLLLLYPIFSPSKLIYVILIQQIIVGVIIEHVTKNNNSQLKTI